MPEPRVILITGASTGIGKACAEYLGARGHRVYGTSRRAPDGVTASGSFNLLRMDVTRQGSVECGIELVMAREGRIDAVMNNAGASTRLDPSSAWVSRT